MLGDDSGIEVAALGGRPGIHSARWSEDWVERLLAELEGRDDRRAATSARSSRSRRTGGDRRRGQLEGAFAEEPRGDEGFGYDPIFVPAGEALTVAELGNAWKDENSHRARAARALAERLAR